MTWFTAGVPDALRRCGGHRDRSARSHHRRADRRGGDEPGSASTPSPERHPRTGPSTHVSQPVLCNFATRRPCHARPRLRAARPLPADRAPPRSIGSTDSRLKAPFHVTVLRGRNVQRAHHFIHTTTELPLIDRATVDGIATLSATRTLIDVARFVRPDRLTAALDAGLRDGLTSEIALHRRITELRSSGRYGIPQLLAVIEGSEISRGGHSWLERRFLELCGRSALPRPRTQQVLTKAGDRLVRVDCRFPGTRVVVELLGYRWHRTKAQMSRDTERLNALIIDGFPPDPVHLQPGHVRSRRHDRHRPPDPRPRVSRETGRLCHRHRRRSPVSVTQTWGGWVGGQVAD